ncbi:MAG: AMP-binding protein, partial [Thermodesulfobacteriota bacterium]|nr:AMP-binding protein [Thermodesulfobacteriota bacterium]
TKKPREALHELLSKINEALIKKIQVNIDSIVPLSDIPRTTSGKTQRFVMRERYDSGEYRDLEVNRLNRGLRSSGGLYVDLMRTRTHVTGRQDALNVDLSTYPDALSEGPKMDILPYFSKNLVEMICTAAHIAPEKGIIFVDVKGNEDLLTYPGLLEAAGKMLHSLRSKGMKPGGHAVLQIDDDKGFVIAFWGAVLGGFIPVPLALPNSFPIAQGAEKVFNVCSLLEDAYIITDQAMDLYKGLDVVSVLSLYDLRKNDQEDRDYHVPKPSDTAYIQFSSGSTGFPKGVVLSHNNLVCNIFALGRATANNAEQKMVDDLFGSPPEKMDYPVSVCSWLPYSHDMGLIGLHLSPLSAGMLQIKMKTSTFVMNPTLNLLLIDKYRVTQIGSPNFGLLWMFNMIQDEAIKDIDLSCVEVLFNGAEPISPTAVRLFVNRFEAYGFNPGAMLPAYGMAEASLVLSTSPVGEESIYHKLNRETFASSHVALNAADNDTFIEFADEGVPLMGVSIRVVDEKDRMVKENVVGHIQIQGPNVTKGYYKNDAANKELFCNDWLRTGDLGFITKGRIVITGRYKDIIFVNGQNYYSSDLEEELQSLPFVGFKNMAVCGVTDKENAREKIVLFMKTKKPREGLLDLLKKINEHFALTIQVTIDSIVPLPDIPRTTSGKTQRFVMRERYDSGEYRDLEVVSFDRAYAARQMEEESRSTQVSAKKAVHKPIDLTGFTDALPLAIVHGDPRQPLAKIVRTLPDILRVACMLAPQSGVLHVDEHGHERMQTYAQIRDTAQCVLGGLRDQGLSPGDHVLLQVQDSPSFLSVFWGVVLGGFIPVPLPVPGGYPVNEGMERIIKVCQVLDSRCIVTDRPLDTYRGIVNTRIMDVDTLLGHAPDTKMHKPKPSDTAYLQFSSGSTGEPKGVILSHSNLLHTIDSSAKSVLDIGEHDRRPLVGFSLHMLKRKLGIKSAGVFSRIVSALSNASLGEVIFASKRGRTLIETLLIFSGNRISANVDLPIDEIRIVNWMPYSHDMGLIGFHLAPTLGGMDQIKLDPKTFIENPALFLRLIDRYRASHVPCPNFAAQWLTLQVPDDAIQGIDLSCIKAWLNGSEPISATTTRDFINKFRPHGFDQRSMSLVYGMAESSLQITCPPAYKEPVFHCIDSDVLFGEKIAL